MGDIIVGWFLTSIIICLVVADKYLPIWGFPLMMIPISYMFITLSIKDEVRK